MNNFTFSYNLKELMERHRLTQGALAKEIGVSQKCVSKWLNDKSEPTLSNIISLCRFFDVSADFLVGLEVE